MIYLATYYQKKGKIMTKNKTMTQTPTEGEQVLMPELDKKRLKELYILRSYSGFEDPIRQYIMNFLTELQIPFINYNGNILGLNHKGAPLFSAHMDMVNTESYILRNTNITVPADFVFTLDKNTNIRLYKDKDKKDQTSLGADDKNGIWVILTLLKAGKEINFAFCHSEEIGGLGSKQIIKHKEIAQFIEDCKFGIILDRRNSDDIIGFENKYCMALDDKLELFAKSKGFKFKCAHGSVSDADQFSQLIECVNLSCGYYEPHSSKEYTNLNELWNTYNFCLEIIDNFDYVSVTSKRIRSFKNVSEPYIIKYEYASSYINKTSNTPYYGSYWKKSEEKEEQEDEKKTSAKTKKKTTKINTISGTTDTMTITMIPEDHYPDNIDGLLVEALCAGSVYDKETKAFYIPMYSAQDIPKDTDPEDLTFLEKCIDCSEELYLTQKSFDSLFDAYYNTRYKVYGICSNCMKVLDLSSTIKYLW